MGAIALQYKDFKTQLPKSALFRLILPDLAAVVPESHASTFNESDIEIFTFGELMLFNIISPTTCHNGNTNQISTQYL